MVPRGYFTGILEDPHDQCECPFNEGPRKGAARDNGLSVSPVIALPGGQRVLHREHPKPFGLSGLGLMALALGFRALARPFKIQHHPSRNMKS